MMTTTLNVAFLQAAGQAGGSSWSFWIMIIALFVIMYFFMIRPQNKKQKEIQNFRNALKVGQEIITIGGIHGVIKNIDETDNTVQVEIATGVKITFDKSAIMPKGTPAGNNKK